MKELSVVLGGRKIGILSQNSNGRMSFSYQADSSRIVSLSMQDKTKAYSHNLCEAYFGGLLPESDAVKRHIASKYHISASNSFSLLEAIGADCAGAIEFYPDVGVSKYIDKYPLRGHILSEKAINNLISELPEKQLLTSFDDLRLSLAGAQDKTSICMINKKFATPVDNCPTTHIIKPEIKGLRSSVENEFFCLSLAKALGINAVNVDIGIADKTKFLLIERFDRIKEKINDIAFLSRIHQEDFCQALGVSASQKYENEGGPGILECLKLIDNLSKPALEKTSFIEYFLFNLMVGNNDAHGKNYSIFHHDDGSIALTPIYDVLCTTIYETLSKKMAMKIGTTYLFSAIKKSDFESIFDKGEFSSKLLQNIISQYGKKIEKASQKVINIMKAHHIKLDMEFVHRLEENNLRNLEMLSRL